VCEFWGLASAHAVLLVQVDGPVHPFFEFGRFGVRHAALLFEDSGESSAILFDECDLIVTGPELVRLEGRGVLLGRSGSHLQCSNFKNGLG